MASIGLFPSSYTYLSSTSKQAPFANAKCLQAVVVFKAHAHALTRSYKTKHRRKSQTAKNFSTCAGT